MNILLFWSICFIFLSNTALCFKLDEKIFCPNEITCSREKSISSCKFSDDQTGLWSKPIAQGQIKKGTYRFTSVYASYQAQINDPIRRAEFNPSLDKAQCNYKLESDISDAHFIELNTNSFEELVEASPDEVSQWRLYSPVAGCEGGISQACPLARVPSLKFIVESSSELYISANGIIISGLIQNKNKGFSVLTMYEAWDACSDTGLCLLHLMLKNGEQSVDLGGVIVDMSNGMSAEDYFDRPRTNFEILINRDEPNIIKISPTVSAK
ncbi:hypothetical protein J2N86_16040 (plasmid) [Legionella lytica]|uniref:Uncharacterized protein n=1 Tax=Legionella lytica TaxID=96232 RepID=A0ABY4YD43_9GAMM|nr:hypothetical protein [Legionella lytica]USQ15535.1 hypothetical protein J2N86_16040 [Legionella lytica]